MSIGGIFVIPLGGSSSSGSGAAFSTIQPDAGTSPVATGQDTLTLTSTDNSLVITGNSATDTITFTAGSNLALLGGRSGGQTLKGDTASGGNLTLMSTANATKGKILFGTSAYDEVNNRIGIRTASPSYAGHFVASAINESVIGLVPSSGSNTVVFRFEGASNTIFRIDLGASATPMIYSSGNMGCNQVGNPLWKLMTGGASTQTNGSTFLGRDTGDPIFVVQNTSSTANNFSGIGFVGNGNDSTALDSAILGCHLSHTGGAESGALTFWTRDAGTIAERWRIDKDGTLQNKVAANETAAVLGTAAVTEYLKVLISGGGTRYIPLVTTPN